MSNFGRFPIINALLIIILINIQCAWSHQAPHWNNRNGHNMKKYYGKGERRVWLPPFFQNVCDGNPFIVSRTEGVSNGECPFNKALSCTCVEQSSSESWELNIQRKVNKDMKVPPSNISSSTSIFANAIGPITVPGNLKHLKYRGIGPLPVKLSWKIDGGFLRGLVSCKDVACSFETIEVDNIDMSRVRLQDAYLPISTKNLTLRNTNISYIGTTFLIGLPNLEYLDFSHNKLISLYEGLLQGGCSPTCVIREINLNHNNFTVIPPALMSLTGLQILRFVGNNLSEPITKETYTALQKLKLFEYDGTWNSCENGSIVPLHATKVCVLGLNESSPISEAPPTTTTTEQSNADGDKIHLWSYAIVGCSIVVAVIILMVANKSRMCRRLRGQEIDDTKDFNSMFDNTLSYDETDPRINECIALLRDPGILTNLLPYRDIRMGPVLKRGGFGIVYSGIYDGRRIAVKKIRSDRSSNMDNIELFINEILLMASLKHPRIVEFIGVAWDTLRNICAVTELMDRGDLREVLSTLKKRDCRLTWPNHKTRIVLHVAEALAYLHSLQPKVLHRDLKSKNILLNQDLEAKLSDFGIARKRRHEETHMTTGVGTSFWIAPEVLLGKDYDESADIFSFGVVLCEVDTDDYPYVNNPSDPLNDAGIDVDEHFKKSTILNLVVSGKLKPAFSLDCPKEIKALADRCLQNEPSMRPTAAQILDELDQILRRYQTQVI